MHRYRGGWVKIMTTKKKTIKPRASTGPQCECGGTFKRVTLTNFDFSRYSGLPSFLDGVPGWKCGSCKREMLLGQAINISLFFIAMLIVRSPGRLTPGFARYLRRSMQITQQELADRMGVARETVASWESNLKEISPQHDLILRVLISNHATIRTSRNGGSSWFKEVLVSRLSSSFSATL